MTPEQSELVRRIRALLVDEPAVREVSMFGGRAIMVNEKMIVSAGKDGSLLVRVDAARHDELLDEAGTAQATMGAGRSMGRGWIDVNPEALADQRLIFWVETAMAHNRAIKDGRS
ncbi:MAG: TfoX/Sxy family protein [Actinomycetaceae bacterium]|nr:TfoX/Sxy family protein [Actinomycetaceae bacterium]